MAKNEVAEESSTESGKRKVFDVWLGGINKTINNRYFFAAAFIVIILLAVGLRIGMLKNQGLFEPDGFYYYSIIKQTVSDNFMVPAYSALSGFPVHNIRGEQTGMEYLTILPGIVLQYFGVSYLTVMRLIPVLFGALYAILAYFLARHLSKSKILGLLAMFFVAVSSGNIARTAALVYRGDSFIALPLMVALLFMLKALEGGKKKTAYVILSSVALSTGILVWTGSPFIIAVYMMALLMMIGYGFVVARKELAETNVMLSFGLLLAYLLEHLYVYIGLGRDVGVLYGIDSLGFYIPILLAALAALYLIEHKSMFAMLGHVRGRITIVIVIALAAAAIAFFPVTTYVWNSISGTASTTNATASPVGVTTQELQAPTLQFLFASFNAQLYLAPIGVLLFLLLASRFDKEGKDHFKISEMDLSVNCGFIVAFAYFFVTGFMQSLAIRYNAIVSIPIAIFAAYFIYILWMALKDLEFSNRMLMLLPVAVMSAALIWFAYTSVYSAAISLSLPLLAAGGIITIAIAALTIAYGFYAVVIGKVKVRYLYVGIIAVILMFNLYNTYIASISASQADGINPLFLDAMTWMKNNTPANSTVMSVWPDGSVIEAWANRTSFLDSVGGEVGPRILSSSQFLFNTSSDTQYLYSIYKPDYLVARNFWYQELGGLAVEGMVQNASQYGFVTLSTLQVTHNDTAQFYSFGSDTYKAMLVLKPQQNGTSAVNGFIGSASGNNYAQVKYVMFYNQADYNYSIITSNAPNALNYTLLVLYTNRTITGSIILGLKLPESNLFKFTFLCNYYECPYGDSNATMTAVYINGDTRIFKINYK